MKKGVVKNNRFSEILLFSVFIVIIGLVIVAAIMRHNFQSKNDMKKIEELTNIIKEEDKPYYVLYAKK